jgi:hypothetical protein
MELNQTTEKKKGDEFSEASGGNREVIKHE